MAFSTGSKALIGVGGFFAVIIIAAVSFFGYYNAVRNEGIDLENALEGQYQTNQNELSTYTATVMESIGIADRGTSKQQQIIVEAVKGRYDGKLGAGGTGFLAISEAYPEVTGTTEAYGKVQDAIVAGRAAYKNQQNALIDKIRAYENWSQKGAIKHIFVGMIGFPSPTLEARVGDTTYTGAEALRKMKQIVLTDEAITSYETGKTGPIIAPESAPAKK